MKSFQKLILIAVVYFLILNFLEAAQQYFYIIKFDLANGEEISFFALIKNHSIRWVAWALFAIPLVNFTLNNPINQQNVSFKLLLRYGAYILFFLLLTLLLISLFPVLFEAQPMSDLWEFFSFFAVQKTTLFINAYLGLIILIHLYLNFQRLDVKEGELSKLQERYELLSTNLKESSHTSQEALISIKIGNKIKAITVSDIFWIQSDDYCVKIHTRDAKVYHLRKSMKAMEEELKLLGFIRIHRNSIVNKSEIELIQFAAEPKVRLKNGLELQIALSRVPRLRSLFKEIA